MSVKQSWGGGSFVRCVFAGITSSKYTLNYWLDEKEHHQKSAQECQTVYAVELVKPHINSRIDPNSWNLLRRFRERTISLPKLTQTNGSSYMKLFEGASSLTTPFLGNGIVTTQADPHPTKYTYHPESQAHVRKVMTSRIQMPLQQIQDSSIYGNVNDDVIVVIY